MRDSRCHQGGSLLAYALGIAFIASSVLKMAAIPSGRLGGTIFSALLGENRDVMMIAAVVEGVAGLCILLSVARRATCVAMATALLGIVAYSTLMDRSHKTARPCGCFGHTSVENALHVPSAVRNALFIVALISCARDSSRKPADEAPRDAA